MKRETFQQCLSMIVVIGLLVLAIIYALERLEKQRFQVEQYQFHDQFYHELPNLEFEPYEPKTNKTERQ